MMAGDKKGCEIVFCDTMPVIILIIIIRRTSEVWAAHFMVTLTPAHTLAHFIPGDTGVGAGVVGLVTKILTVLIGIVTLETAVCVVAVRINRKSPTIIAENIMRTR